MINYLQAKNIFKKAKIKIQNEDILIKNSLNRVIAKDIISPSNALIVFPLLREIIFFTSNVYFSAIEISKIKNNNRDLIIILIFIYSNQTNNCDYC